MAFKSKFDTLVLLCNTIKCHGDGGDEEEDDNDFKSTACQDSIKSGQRCGKTTRTTTWPMGPQDYDSDGDEDDKDDGDVVDDVDDDDEFLDRGGSHS